MIMAPISDHKMVTFNITDTSGEDKEFENNITQKNSKIYFQQWRPCQNEGNKLGSSPRRCIYKIFKRLMEILQGC